MRQEDIHIPTPCEADWSAMTGDDRKRFCGKCQKHVHNLSAMTEPQAQKVLAEPEVCVRYTPTQDGGVRFQPTSRRTLLRRSVAAAGLMAASLPAAAAMSTSTEGASCESPGLLTWLWNSIFGETQVVQGGALTVEPLMGEPMPIEPEPAQDTGMVEEPPQPTQPPQPIQGGIGPAPVRMGKPAIRPPTPPVDEE